MLWLLVERAVCWLSVQFVVFDLSHGRACPVESTVCVCVDDMCEQSNKVAFASVRLVSSCYVASCQVALKTDNRLGRDSYAYPRT